MRPHRGHRWQDKLESSKLPTIIDMVVCGLVRRPDHESVSEDASEATIRARFHRSRNVSTRRIDVDLDAVPDANMNIDNP
jgi:hypothetical protein